MLEIGPSAAVSADDVEARSHCSQPTSLMRVSPRHTVARSHLAAGVECSANSWVASRWRRWFDCFVATVLLLLSLPLMGVCALLVRLSSPGPILFRQRRMGRNGREFTLFKFRSMTIDPIPNAPSHTVHSDRRITRVGAVLRRYKLDELPQFWNVLKGDMSLVGPRPKLSHHEALRMPFRPGLTGEATLTFRNEEKMLRHVPLGEVDALYENVFKPIKAKLDSEYMQRATFQSDIHVLWRTVEACLCASTKSPQELSEVLSRHGSAGGEMPVTFTQQHPRWSAIELRIDAQRSGSLHLGDD